MGCGASPERRTWLNAVQMSDNERASLESRNPRARTVDSTHRLPSASSPEAAASGHGLTANHATTWKDQGTALTSGSTVLERLGLGAQEGNAHVGRTPDRQ
jgi:hypothetical protein